MRSAVFVDFDNVFSQLRQLQPEVAERFAREQKVLTPSGAEQIRVWIGASDSPMP